MAKILRELKEEHDVYLCNRTDCDRDLAPIAEDHGLREVDAMKSFDLRAMPISCGIFGGRALAWCPVQLH